MTWITVNSPIGPLRLIATADALTAIEFSPWTAELPSKDQDSHHQILQATAEQLREYFAGTRKEFDLPLAPHGTAFQQQVWDQLLQIPWGETRSYGQLAQALQMTGHASRAVGSANGKNPIPVVIPCHRVIGANGSLTGYAGGLERKKLLLDLESSTLL